MFVFCGKGTRRAFVRGSIHVRWGRLAKLACTPSQRFGLFGLTFWRHIHTRAARSSGIVGLALLDDCLGGLGPTGRAMVSGAADAVMGAYFWIRPGMKSAKLQKVSSSMARALHLVPCALRQRETEMDGG